MRWPARFRNDESGFTLVELIISMAIVGLLISAIGSALFVALRTTDVTNKRMSESHDVQITSSYLANDIQSSNAVEEPSSSTHCPGTATRLIAFKYSNGLWACYFWETSVSKTQVTRTFNGQQVVLAHFADAAIPTITCMPNADCSGTVDSVTMRFTEASGYSYVLFGSRRLYNAAPGGGGGGGGGAPPLTLLASGSGPLWVLGSCKGGNNSDCITATTNSLPSSDLANPSGAWKVAPLWSKLNDSSNLTFVKNDPGSTKEAKVGMRAVAAPAVGTYPTIDIVAVAVCPACSTKAKLTLTLYNGANKTSQDIQIDPLTATPTDYTWTLSNADVNKLNLTPNDYANGNLSIGFAMTTGTNAEYIQLYEVALQPDYGSPVLTVNGGLLVNSTLPNSAAVRLSGTKTFTKLKIIGGVFQILSGSGCVGCNQQTVTCTSCPPPTWQPGSFTPKIPDPLRFMAFPTDAGVTSTSTCPSGYTRYYPGVYNQLLQLQGNVCLDGGIYTFNAGVKVDGNAHVVGQRVMFFNNGGLNAGPITFTGGSAIQLTAYDTAPYNGILIFQARCPGDDPVAGCGSNYNTKPLSLSGGSVVGQNPSCTDNSHASLLGVIYAPASTGVTLGTGGANMCVTAVIAQNVTVTGNSQVTIG